MDPRMIPRVPFHPKVLLSVPVLDTETANRLTPLPFFCPFSLHSASPLTHAFSTNDHGPQHKLHFSSLSLSRFPTQHCSELFYRPPAAASHLFLFLFPFPSIIFSLSGVRS